MTKKVRRFNDNRHKTRIVHEKKKFKLINKNERLIVQNDDIIKQHLIVFS